MTPLARYLTALRLAFQNRDQAIEGGLPLLARAFQALQGALLGELANETKRGELTVAMLPDLEAAMRRGLQGAWPAVGDLILDGLRRQWAQGMVLPDLGSAAAGLQRPLPPPPDRALASIVTRFAADRVRHLEGAATENVTRLLRLGVLGHMTPSAVQLQIAQYLGIPARSGRGYPGELWRQAERVWRTESLNMFNGAAAERLRDLAAREKGWRKMWQHGGRPLRPRPYHLKVLHGQILGATEDFTVMGPDGTAWKAFGPHDPRLPASEVVNCGCSLVMLPPGLLPVTADQDMQERLRRRQGRYQADWIRQHRPDLAETPEGREWVSQYRPEASPFL